MLEYVDNETAALGRAWYPVALSREVPERRPVSVELLGTHWVVTRLGDRLTAFVDECPHRLLPLSAGSVCGELLQCAYHGWRFGTDGKAVLIPSNGPGQPVPPRAHLTPPAGLEERYGAVWLAPLEPVTSIPLMDEWDDPTFEVRLDNPARTTAGAHQAMDNGCDTSHFGFVHAGTFGGEAAEITRAKTIRRVGWTVVADYETTYTVLDDPELEASGENAQTSRQTKTFVPGAAVLLRMEFPATDSVFTILAAAQPEHDGSTRFYRWWARNDIVGDEERWNDCIDVELKVLQEDLRALNAFRARRLPLDLQREVHVSDDKMSIAYRRLLADLVALDQ